MAREEQAQRRPEEDCEYLTSLREAIRAELEDLAGYALIGMAFEASLVDGQPVRPEIVQERMTRAACAVVDTVCGKNQTYGGTEDALDAFRHDGLRQISSRIWEKSHRLRTLVKGLQVEKQAG